MKKAAKKRTRLVVLEAPETSPWARIRALEARIVDVEMRHEEAIARLSMALGNLFDAQQVTLNNLGERVTKARVTVDALVPAAAERVFEEWDRETDLENVRDFERLKSLDVVANPKKRARGCQLEHEERARDRKAAAGGVR